MLGIRRHEFVPDGYQSQAYEDHPIPIGENQTVSQPFIIAVPLQALALTGTEVVLEVGTGSGYQAALLAVLARNLHPIESFSTLAHRAEIIPSRLGLNKLKVVSWGGSHGLEEF